MKCLQILSYMIYLNYIIANIAWERVKCQVIGCLGGKDNLGVKICINPSFSIQYTENPPPCIICQCCYLQYIKDIKKKDTNGDNLNTGQECIDLIAPLEYVALKCDNKNCPDPMQNAEFTCFSPECTHNNDDHPVRYCPVCFKAKHSTKMGRYHGHIYQEKIKPLWIPPKNSTKNGGAMDDEQRTSFDITESLDSESGDLNRDEKSMFPDQNLIVVESIVRLLMGIECPTIEGTGRKRALPTGTSGTTKYRTPLKRYQSIRDDLDEPMTSSAAAAAATADDHTLAHYATRAFSFEDRLWLSRYGVYLLLSLCDNYLQAPPEQLGRLLAALFHWFDSTAYMPEGGLASSVEALKPDRLCDWIQAKTHVTNLTDSTCDIEATEFCPDKYFDTVVRGSAPSNGFGSSNFSTLDPFQRLFLACLAPDPPAFSRVTSSYLAIDVPSRVDRCGGVDALKRGLSLLFCLVPYDLITFGAWQVLFPLWMERARTTLEPNDIDGDIALLFKKTFDMDMSPLQFSSPKHNIFMFVTDRLAAPQPTNKVVAGASVSVGNFKAYDALVWLEILTASEVLVPMDLLMEAFLKYVANHLIPSHPTDGYFTPPFQIPERYREDIDRKTGPESDQRIPTRPSLTADKDLMEWEFWRDRQPGQRGSTFSQLYTMAHVDDLHLFCVAIMLHVLKHQMKLHNVTLFANVDNVDEEEMSDKILTLLLHAFDRMYYSVRVRCEERSVYTYYSETHFRNYWRLLVYSAKICRDIVKLICPEFAFSKSRSESDIDPSLVSSDTDDDKSIDSGIFAKESDSSTIDKKFKILRTTASGLFSKDGRFMGKPKKAIPDAIPSPSPMITPKSKVTSSSSQAAKLNQLSKATPVTNLQSIQSPVLPHQESVQDSNELQIVRESVYSTLDEEGTTQSITGTIGGIDTVGQIAMGGGEGEEEEAVESFVTLFPTHAAVRSDTEHLVTTIEPLEEFVSGYEVEKLETPYTVSSGTHVETVVNERFVETDHHQHQHQHHQPDRSLNEYESYGSFWPTTQGEFRIEYALLPVRFRLVHSIFKLVSELNRILPDIKEATRTVPKPGVNEDDDTTAEGSASPKTVPDVWNLPLEGYEELERFRVSASYHCLTCLNDLVIAGKFLIDDRGENRGFLIWCQENVIIRTLWSLLGKQDSYVNQLTLPLFLKCLTLPSGKSSFWKELIINYYNSDWRVRVSAINSLMSLFQFFDCEEDLRMSEECQNCLSFAFYIFAQTLKDGNLHVSQYTKLLFHSLPFSSFKIIFKPLTWQFSSLPLDRFPILTMVRSMLLAFKPRVGQKSTRDFYVYIFYYNATDFLLRATETVLIEQYLETYHRTKITPLYGYRPNRKDRKSQISRFNEILVSASHSTAIHSIKLTMDQVSDGSGNSSSDTDSNKDSDRRMDRKRDGQHPPKPNFDGILADKFASIDALVVATKQSIEENTSRNRDQERSSVDVVEKLNDEPSNLIHTLYTNVTKVPDCGIHMRSIVETLMQVLSSFHSADAGRIEKRASDCLNESITYLQQLLYYHPKEKVFTLPPHALRSYPLTNSVLTFLYRVLDLNVAVGYKLLQMSLDLLAYLPSPQLYATDAIPAYYTLHYLSRAQRKFWLSATNVILYKYEIDENPASFSLTVTRIIEIILNSLMAQYSHSCQPLRYGVRSEPHKSLFLNKSIPSTAAIIKSFSRRSSPAYANVDPSAPSSNMTPRQNSSNLTKFSSFLKPAAPFGKGGDDEVKDTSKLNLYNTLSPAFSFESLTSVLKKSPQSRPNPLNYFRRASSVATAEGEEDQTASNNEDDFGSVDKEESDMCQGINDLGLGYTAGEYGKSRKCPKCDRLMRELYDDEVLGLAIVALEMFARRCPIAATPYLLNILVIVSKIVDNVFYPWEDDPFYENYEEGNGSHSLHHLHSIGQVCFTSMSGAEANMGPDRFTSFSSSIAGPTGLGTGLDSINPVQATSNGTGIGSNLASSADTFFIPGHCRSIALQMMRCVLHQYAPNGLFLRYFTSTLDHKRPLFLVNRVVAESLRGFTEFTPLHPLTSMLQDLEKEKGVLALPQDKLASLLLNARDYLECVSKQEKFSAYWKSHLFPLLETFFANLASGIAVGTGNAQSHNLLLTINYKILFDIMISLLKIPSVSFFKNLFESMGKLLIFMLSKFPLDVTKLWELCFLCNNNLAFSKERDKQFLARIAISELGQVVAFKKMILPTNVLMIIQLVLFDVGGSLGAAIMKMFTYDTFEEDNGPIDAQNLINSSAGESMRPLINECVSFLTDIDAIARLGAAFKTFSAPLMSSPLTDHKGAPPPTPNTNNEIRGGPLYYNLLLRPPILATGNGMGGDQVSIGPELIGTLRTYNEGATTTDTELGLDDIRISSYSNGRSDRIAPPTNPGRSSGPGKGFDFQQIVNAPTAPRFDTALLQKAFVDQNDVAKGPTTGRKPSTAIVTEDNLGAYVKIGLAQFVALEMSRENDRYHGNHDVDYDTKLLMVPWMRTYFSFLYQKAGSPNPSLQLSPPSGHKNPLPLIAPHPVPMTNEQQGLKDFNECVNRIRMLCWLLLASLQHSCLTKTSISIPCQPIGLDHHPRISDLILHLVSRFPEFSAASVLHTTALFYGFMLCQLWTVYCEYIISTYPVDNEKCLQAENGLMAFWCQIIPGILQLITISKSFPEMISIHFLNLIESLQEINSSSLIKLYPLWRPILYYQEVLPSHLQIRQNKILNWLPALDLNEGNPFHNAPFLDWLRKLQFKLGHTEMQSSLAIQIYTL